MKIINKFNIIILLLILNGCGQQAGQQKSEVKEDPQQVFEPVDVYGNPNNFEQQMGRLKPGDLPPTMKIEQWFNGTPVTGFEKGKVYVVEFFASWCQPCRKSIPHLNKLQQEFAEELVVIGLAASEAEPNTKKLEKLINSKKDVLTYRVAYTSDEKTFKDWNWGARNTGLPWAFIIDQKGRIAWYGQPFYSRFEPVLRSVLAGNYLYSDDKLIQEKNYESRKVLWDVQERFWEAVGNEDWPTGVTYGEQLLTSGDQLFYYEMAQLFQIKYQQLDQKEEGMSLAQRLINGPLKGIPEGMAFISEVIEGDPGASAQSIAFALRLAENTNQLTYYENSELLLLLGKLYEKSSAPDEAKKAYQLALTLNDDEELEAELMSRLGEN